MCRRDRVLAPLFLGVFSADTLPAPRARSCFVANLDPARAPGSHWVAVAWDARMRGTYFDTFGRPAPDAFRAHFGAHDYERSTRVIQSSTSEVCATFCYCYLHVFARGASLAAFLALLPKRDNDELVVLGALLLQLRHQ